MVGNHHFHPFIKKWLALVFQVKLSTTSAAKVLQGLDPFDQMLHGLLSVGGHFFRRSRCCFFGTLKGRPLEKVPCLCLYWKPPFFRGDMFVFRQCILVGGWWLNQPIWTVCGSQIGSFPQIGVGIKTFDIFTTQLVYDLPWEPMFPSFLGGYGTNKNWGFKTFHFSWALGVQVYTLKKHKYVPLHCRWYGYSTITLLNPWCKKIDGSLWIIGSLWICGLCWGRIMLLHHFIIYPIGSMYLAKL